MSAAAVPTVRVDAGPPAGPSRAVVGLGWLIAFLSLLAAGTGLLSSGGPGRRAFTTVHGQTVELYGRGLYQHDTVFAAAGQRGGDVVMVFIGVPLLILSLTVYRRGTAWSRLLLTGTLAYFLYVYASAALGTVAYNSLFLLYVVIASAALFAFLLAFPSVEPASWRSHADKHGPRRFAAVFMLISAGVTATVWTLPLLGTLAGGAPPDRLDSYSTPVTYALDLAVITPAAAIAGLLILRRRWLGHVVAVSLLVLEVMLAPLIVAQTVSQVAAGISLQPAEVAGPVAGFVVIAVVAGWVLVSVLRGIRASGRQRPVVS